MKITIKIGFCVLFLASLISCKKDNNFPDEPVIEVRDFYKQNNNIAIWKIGFTDGDGDIGVRNAADEDNFIVSIFSIIDGRANEREGQAYRIPVVENIRTAAGIEGEFEFKIETDLLLLDSIPIDSAYYRAYVIDRSGNQSNTVETPIFSTN
ncbi:MAG: hypothetical protein RJQ00_10025 [Vicingaceae bacterium]